MTDDGESVTTLPARSVRKPTQAVLNRRGNEFIASENNEVEGPVDFRSHWIQVHALSVCGSLSLAW